MGDSPDTQGRLTGDNIRPPGGASRLRLPIARQTRLGAGGWPTLYLQPAQALSCANQIPNHDRCCPQSDWVRPNDNLFLNREFAQFAPLFIPPKTAKNLLLVLGGLLNLSMFVVFWSVMIFASIAWHGFLIFSVGFKGGREIKAMTREFNRRDEERKKR